MGYRSSSEKVHEISAIEQAKLRVQLEKAQDVAIELILQEPSNPLVNEPQEFSERMDAAMNLLAQIETNASPAVSVIPKKKHRGSSKNKSITVEFTGFEPFFADAPVRPEEAMIESEIYSLDKTPFMRMESCIRRYRAVRNLDNPPWRKSIFDAYLTLGGISTGQKDFGSAAAICSVDIETNDQMRAVDFIDETRDDQEVDFVYLVQAFCSSRCIAAIGQSSPQRFWEAPNVIINFLKYVNRHDALPEYLDQINTAIAFLEVAQEELRAVKLFALAAPGNLNIALSVLHGGYYRNLYENQLESGSGRSDERERFMDRSSANAIVSSQLPSMALTSTHEFCIRRVERGLPVELVRIEVLNDELSMLILKPWKHIPGANVEDMIESDLFEINVPMEKTIAARIFPKLHFDANFYQVKDFWFFDTVTRTLPSFYIEIGDEENSY